jgi:hypothetical protein
MNRQASAGIAALWAVSLLLLASLACAQAGEILTPAEATARAEATQNPARPNATPGAVGESAGESPSVPEGPQVGDVVYLTGKGFLVKLVAEPGATGMIANQERGAEVTIVEITEHEGEIWYKIDAPTGEGWVPAENVTTEAP